MPFHGGIAFRRLADRCPGIIDQDVEPAKARDRRFDHRPARALIGNIERGESTPGAECGEFGRRRFALLGVARRQHDCCTRCGKPLRHAETDPAIATGDDGDTSGKIEQCHREPLPRERCLRSIDSDRA